ncbi:uncharacterized protein ATC70_011861 [Mucor velutinosus]|uniref:Uncharacterized protein n=1 Tax=Mucor velutinosus TaxID=708070 RepID=A0AAN7HYD4_9FUNG|nr:hypothetical protein ATC70_011861 [Mucor velutinosus]
MSASPASPAPSRTMDVIVSIHENEPAIQLKFLSERLNWDNLVSFIQSSSTLEPPVVLYYKLAFDAPTKTLESQEHLNQLLSTLDSPSSLRFYGHQEHVASPVFVSSTAAFARLGALVDQHKHVLKSSYRLSRWIGVLASMMATSDRSFEHEFQVLESLIQRKALKLERRSAGRSDKKKDSSAETDGVISAAEDEEFAESPQVIDLDARLDNLDISGRPGFGGHFGRRGPGFGFGRRGRHGYGFFEGCLGGAKNDKPEIDLNFENTRQAFAQFHRDRLHHRHHDRPHPPHNGPSSDSEGEANFGKFSGGRHHRHHHHHHHHGRPHPYSGPRPFGGPFSFDALSDSDEDFFGPHRGKHFDCRGGRGGRGGFGFGFGFGPGFGGAPPAFGNDKELFGCRGFGGPGFGGRHGFGKHDKHHCE